MSYFYIGGLPMWFDDRWRHELIFQAMPVLRFEPFKIRSPEEIMDDDAAEAHEALFAAPIAGRPSGILLGTDPIGSMRWSRSKART